jgi:hypothetical protein
MGRERDQVPLESRVGPYRILRLIRRGGQGSVYLGFDNRLRRRVAIKIYPLPAERAARRALQHEAQLVASIDSPKVVHIHDVIESSEHLAMVMEYIPGCDLEEFLASSRPSLASVLTIATDIAGALAAARQQQVVHGDLKAANVLIGTTGRVKLTDFGIARRGDLASPGGGSASALTPEHLRGLPLDERSDLFALGCLMYRMLAGAHPFYRDGQLDAGMLLERSPPPLEERVPADMMLAPELAALVAQLLARDPCERPASTRVVRQVLRRVARTIPLAAGNSLLLEARPCFRPESPEDIPPAVPADLGREGRSSLPVAFGPGNRLARPGTWGRAALVAAMLGLAGVGLGTALIPAETRIHIDAPQLRLVPGVRLPEGVDSRWLVREVTAAVSEQLGPLRVTGPVGATPVTTLYSDPARQSPAGPPPERMQLDLRCMEMLCVLALSRLTGDSQTNHQAVLFPDMSRRQWRDIVQASARALYP